MTQTTTVYTKTVSPTSTVTSTTVLPLTKTAFTTVPRRQWQTSYSTSVHISEETSMTTVSDITTTVFITVPAVVAPPPPKRDIDRNALRTLIAGEAQIGEWSVYDFCTCFFATGTATTATVTHNAVTTALPTTVTKGITKVAKIASTTIVKKVTKTKTILTTLGVDDQWYDHRHRHYYLHVSFTKSLIEARHHRVFFANYIITQRVSDEDRCPRRSSHFWSAEG